VHKLKRILPLTFSPSYPGFRELLQHAARGLRSLTNYEKVMIYKFHIDDHGEVIAEDKIEGVDSFLGYHYPASDIPSQSRNFFLKHGCA
jgi:chemotaxis family two-component system sensor kinase Cph1